MSVCVYWWGVRVRWMDKAGIEIGMYIEKCKNGYFACLCVHGYGMKENFYRDVYLWIWI